MFAPIRADAEEFMGLRGIHKFNLDLKAGLYYLTGKNLDNPAMGANACGKSTLLNLIYWIITGDLLDLMKPGDEVQSWTATKKRVRGTLWFEIDEQFYGLRRTRGPNALLLMTGREGEWVQVDQAHVQKLFGLSPEALKRTIILGQFSELFLDLKPTAQSQFFTDVLDLDFWIGCAKLANGEKQEADRTHSALTQEAARLSGSKQTTEDHLVEARAANARWAEEHADRVEVAEGDVTKAETWLAEDESDLSATPKPATSAEIEEDQVEIKRLRTTNNEANISVTTKRREIAVVQQNKGTATTSRTRMVNAKVDKSCPECGQTVPVKHLTDRIAEIDDELDGYSIKLRLLDDELEAAEAHASDTVAALKIAEDALAPKLRKQTEIASIYAAAEAKVASTKRDLDNRRTQLARLKAETNPHGGAVVRAKDKLADLESDLLENASKLEAALKQSEAASLNETYFKEIRLGMIEDVLAEMEITVGNYAEQLGLVDWKIKFSTEKELKAGGTSVGLTTMLYPPGVTKGINWHVYSGGERQRWQLATTFGLSEVLLGRAGLESTVEFLDEPSDGMSAEGLESLIEHLSQRARNHNKAIIFVDHHILDRGLFDHVMVMTRENGASTMEVVS